MKVAVYAGTFNPWHRGHQEVVEKALQAFDQVIVAQGFNPMKNNNNELRVPKSLTEQYDGRVIVTSFTTMLVDFLKTVPVDAVIKGLRSTIDFEYEKAQQYYNEDLGIHVPVYYVIAGRDTQHISSSAERAVKAFNDSKK